MQYLGDFAANATVDFMWSSNGADGASITRATNGTISVYKGNSTTQTTTGVTDTEDFDSLTGIHHCRIATTDAFYATGNNFMVVLSGATIDGKTVNAVLAQFSIQNRYPSVADVQSGLATAAAVTTVAGYIDTEVAAILAAVDTEVAAIKAKTDNLPASPAAVGSAMTLSAGAITAAVIATGAIDADALATDAVDEIVDAVWDELVIGHTTAGTMGELQELGTVDWTAEIADAVWDELLAGHTTTDSAGEALTDAAAGGGGGSGDITAIDGSTTAADNLRKWFDGTGYNSANSRVGTVGTVSGTVSANMVSLGGDSVAYDKWLNLAKGAVVGLVGSGTNTTTVVTGLGLSSTTGFYVGKTFIATTGSNAGQGGKLVTAYDGATGRLTIEALTSAMTPGDIFVLVG